MEKKYFEKVDEAGKFLSKKIKAPPKIMLVLSGGLNKFAEEIEGGVAVSAADIPHFPAATAEGHSGRIIFGRVAKVPVAVLQGRYHFYEGHEMRDVVFPTFVMNALGAKVLITTNATGGINKGFRPGDIMMITDHINFMGASPLRGIATVRKEDQFTDMTEPYGVRLMGLAREAAKKEGIALKEGVYLASPGPNYETRSEIAMFRAWGADAVGMSVVPEITAAKFLGMETLGFSCIANPAADIHAGGMNHHEVLEAMRAMEDKLVRLLAGVIGKMSA